MSKIKKLLMALAILAAPISATADNRSVNCLAKNVYYEARGENLAGKLAVAKVTLNRVGHANFPDTVCGVVYQPNQFSWTNNKALLAQKRDPGAWQEAVNIAKDAYYSGLEELNRFEATYFHSVKVHPNWNLKRVARIGNHYFYTDKNAKLQRNR